MMTKRCIWTEYEYWETSCNAMIDLPDLPKTETGYIYCPYCSKKMTEKKL